MASPVEVWPHQRACPGDETIVQLHEVEIYTSLVAIIMIIMGFSGDLVKALDKQ